MNQSTRHLLMIRPVMFGYNAQTAESNAFQNRADDQQQVQQCALEEFDGFVNILRDNGVDVTVIDDTSEPHTPDSIFPNNWVSFHSNGDIFIYPMQAHNRRLERRDDIITQLKKSFKVNHITDLSRFEANGQFLEGTGSMVLDRQNSIAYACHSPRTDEGVLQAFCTHTGYKAATFNAADQSGKAIYHTNVLMCIGSRFAVICMESVSSAYEREMLATSLQITGKEIITIAYEQMNRFAGNMLEVKNHVGETLIVMSRNAYQSLNPAQERMLSGYGKLVYANISTIENNGGGSARCMMAEVHLPINDQGTANELTDYLI